MRSTLGAVSYHPDGGPRRGWPPASFPSAPPVAQPLTPPTAAPAGWYPDAEMQGQWRWWSGTEWGPRSMPIEDSSSRWFAPLPRLGSPAAVAALVAIAALFATNFIAAQGGTVGALVGLGALVGTAIGFPLLAWVACRQWGSGSMRRDIGFAVRWLDIPLGVLGAIVGTIAIVIVGVLTRVLDLDQASNLSDVQDQMSSNPSSRLPIFIMLIVLAGVLAPITEELLFRGVLMHGLRSRMGNGAAIVTQGVVFGFAHFLPGEGWANLPMVAGLGLLGIALGYLRWASGRLGTAMIAHAVFNMSQLTLLYLTVANSH